MTTSVRKAVAGQRASASAAQRSSSEPGRTYFDIVRKMTTDPQIRKVVDETERIERRKRRKS